MIDGEDELVGLTDLSSPSLDEFKDLLREDMSGEPLELKEGHLNNELGDDKPLTLSADVVPAPSCGRSIPCSCPEFSGVTGSLQSIQLQLQFFLNRADDLHDSLVNGNSHLDRETLASAVSSLLYTCQPYFNQLESTGRSTVSPCPHAPVEYCSKLLDFSQQLCDRLEQLLLTYASYELITLDEADPNSVSHFCIGQIQLGRMKLTAFLYCKPTPYLSSVDTGVYKRMRWNVEMLQEDEQRGEDSENEEEIQTDFYFLCYEDIPNAHSEPGPESEDVPHDNVLRMWSIGQWVQVKPQPTTADIYDWILCDVPEAGYRRLLFLGPNEPSSSTATDYLQQQLLSSSCRSDRADALQEDHTNGQRLTHGSSCCM